MIRYMIRNAWKRQIFRIAVFIQTSLQSLFFFLKRGAGMIHDPVEMKEKGWRRRSRVGKEAVPYLPSCGRDGSLLLYVELLQYCLRDEAGETCLG